MSTVLSGPRPDVTPAQVVGLLLAGVPVIANLLRAFGLFDATPGQQQALQDRLTWGAVIAGGLFLSDAGLRAARVSAEAKREVAAPSTPADPSTLPAFADDDHDADDPRSGAGGRESGAVPDEPELVS